MNAILRRCNRCGAPSEEGTWKAPPCTRKLWRAFGLLSLQAVKAREGQLEQAREHLGKVKEQLEREWALKTKETEETEFMQMVLQKREIDMAQVRWARFGILLSCLCEREYIPAVSDQSPVAVCADAGRVQATLCREAGVRREGAPISALSPPSCM